MRELMSKIVLVTASTANAGRQESYDYLASLDGSVSRNIEHALSFDNEEQIKELNIRSTFIMFEYDGKDLKRLGYIM